MAEQKEKLDTSGENTNSKNKSSEYENEPNSAESDSDENWEEQFSNLHFDPIEGEEPVLKAPTVNAVIEYIKSGNCKNIITMAGAGISTSAGIPDFRSPETGLYNNLSEYDLPEPEDIFSLDYFKINPKPFFTLVKKLFPAELKPCVSHYFIRLLHEKNLLLRHYTQNIDTLEYIAGIPSDKIVDAHGSFRTAHCITCSKEYSQEWLKEKIFSELVPKCESCGGVVKPDIVLFGECLPEEFHDKSEADFGNCDLLIIMGTSLSVEPFASLLFSVSKTCPRLLINKEISGITMISQIKSITGIGHPLEIGFPGNTRDVGLTGDCDENCNNLAKKLGWKEDLDAIMLLPTNTL